MSHTGAVIAAGGLGSRMSAAFDAGASVDEDTATSPVKQLLALAGKPVLWHVVHTMLQVTEIEEFVAVVPAQRPELHAEIREICREVGLSSIHLVPGGPERQESVSRGLKALSAGVGLVAIHDAARPLVRPDEVRAVLRAAGAHGAATVGVPVKETLAEADSDGWVRKIPPREGWWSVRTPQAFDRALVLEAHARAEREGWRATDDAGLVSRLGRAIRMVEGSHENIKLTTPSDLRAAEAMLGGDRTGHRPEQPGGPLEWEPRSGGPRGGSTAPAVRVGLGYDIHRLKAGRPLVLGGVTIPSKMGLDGHSDADVILHAVMDALLGAAGEGDIGRRFPNTDPSLRGISSLVLLGRVRELLAKLSVRPGNVDVAVVAEEPKLSPHVEQMAANITGTLRLPPHAVAVKATTHEGVGALGRGEGIAAWATATVVPSHRAGQG